MSEFGRDEKYWSERLNNAKDDAESLLCLTKLEVFELKAKISELENGVLAQRIVDLKRKNSVMQAQVDVLSAKAERLRGIKPELPPYPGESFDGKLPRYGIKWNGPTAPLAVPMDDGYWTPYHLAVAGAKCDT